MDQDLHKIRAIALPAIATNVTVPLLGLVDTAITGHLGATAYIGAVAVGGMMFNMMYWLLGFLRMATSGITAQAHGADDHIKTDEARWQSMSYALALGTAIIVLQWPLLMLMRLFFAPSADIDVLAARYFQILVWGAPAVLMTHSLSGWFLGMQDARNPMVIAVTQNIVNIVASLILVLGFGLKIEGVAFGTLIAQWAGFAIAIWRYHTTQHRPTKLWNWLLRGGNRFFSISRDIFLRTLCLVAVMSWFTRTGTAQGETILATNTVLMEFFVITSYILDGLANAGEAIGGSLFGAGDTRGLRRILRKLILIGAAVATGFTIAFIIGGEAFIALLTDIPEVRITAANYMIFIIFTPIISFIAFLLDGVFIGCTQTRAMLLSVAIASGLFFLMLQISVENANKLLWTAFLSYLGVRGLILCIATPQLLHAASRNKRGKL